MIDPRVASGLRDLLPTAMLARERALHAFRESLGCFGFVPIETPHIERMEVLTGKGAGSDEVLRQIYEVTNRGGERGELGLRFDLTVPLARFVARNIATLGRPFKRYAVGSVFRGERPAKGRFREFLQCDFDIVGAEGLLSDAEVVQVVHDVLARIGVPAFTISLNHRQILNGLLAQIGPRDDSGRLAARILRSLDKLNKIGPDGVLAELQVPITYLDGGSVETSMLGLSSDQAHQVLDFVAMGQGGVEVLDLVAGQLTDQPSSQIAINRLREVIDLAVAGGVPPGSLRIDVGLARGLDYYTGVVLETTVDGWERFGSVASGGRYDNLTRLFTDQPLPGVGASIGLDRLLALAEEAGWAKGGNAAVPVLIPHVGGVDPRRLVAAASRLRAAGIGAEVFPDAIPLGKQFQYGSTRGHRFAVILPAAEGDNAPPETFAIRELATRTDRKDLPLLDLETVVLKTLASGAAAKDSP